MSEKSIHIKFGVQGSGKTLSGVYELQKEAYNTDRLRKAYTKIAKYNSMGFNFSYPEIMSACDFDCEIHHFGKSPTKAYFVNGFYLGLPNDNMRTMRIPPYTYILLDEGNKYFNSRNDKIMPQWRSRFFELMRHFGYELTICCQRPGLVDRNIRELADFEEYLGTELIYDAVGRCIEIQIKHRHFETCADVENYISNGALPKYAKIETQVIDCLKPCNNILEYYDTEFFEYLFLKNCENKDFDYKKPIRKCLSIDDIKLFNKAFDYRVPKEIYKDK